MDKFSLVCPVKDEIHLIPYTLPTFYRVGPSEVILCFDDPPDEKAYELCKNIAEHFKGIPTRFLFVDRNHGYSFHQAYVRRKGFLEANNEKVLTTDIDLVINEKVHKAVELVGDDNTGLVSCYKQYPFKSLMGIWRNVAYRLVRYLYPIRFTGLYCVFKAYWLDSEDEGIKRLNNPKHGKLNEVSTGEDTYLRNCMVKKHRVKYLPDVGATVLTPNIEDLPRQQFENGRYFASQGYSIFQIFWKMLLYLRVHLLLGWLYERRKQKSKSP